MNSPYRNLRVWTVVSWCAVKRSYLLMKPAFNSRKCYPTSQLSKFCEIRSFFWFHCKNWEFNHRLYLNTFPQDITSSIHTWEFWPIKRAATETGQQLCAFCHSRMDEQDDPDSTEWRRKCYWFLRANPSQGTAKCAGAAAITTGLHVALLW